MPAKKGVRAACMVCGGAVDEGGTCTRCGTKIEGDPAAPPADLSRDDAIRLFGGMQGVGEDRAAALYDGGYTTLAQLRDAPSKELARVPGFDETLAQAVRTSASALLGSGAGAPVPGKSDDALRRWLSGDNGSSGLSSWLGEGNGNGDTAVKQKAENTDALRKWLSGEEGAFEDWVGKDTGVLPVAFDVQAPEATAPAPDDSVRAELSRYLEQAKAGDLNPLQILEEAAGARKDLDDAQKRVTELEEEIRHVKKGSIAVIKYVKAQQAKTGGQELKRQLTEEANQRKKLEIQLKSAQDSFAQLQKRLETGTFANKKDLVAKETDLAKREAEIKAAEEEVKSLREAAEKGELDFSGSEATVELQHRLSEELRQREEEFHQKETDLRKQVSDMEGELNKARIDLKQQREAQQLSGKSSGEINAVLAQKESEIQAKEKSVLIREQEIERLKEELKFKEEEWARASEPLKYKEEEMARREQEVEYLLKKIEADKRKIEEAKALGGSTVEVELKQRLEQIKSEITMKEEEVRSKEKYLKAKMEELRLREQGLVEEEIEAREDERSAEMKKEKCKTGIPRLDDLLLGGIPFGANVIMYGPAFVGKEVVIDLFMAEGLKKGIPVVWVLTEKAPMDIREEMIPVLPSYEQYEKMGLVWYVDAYSRSMGATDSEANTTYVNEPTDHEGILKAVDELAKEFKKKYSYYRLAFRSVSTMIAFLDTTTAFKFLQPFTGRRKRERAVSMFVLEKGMHEEQDIQMLGSLMDGMVDFKLEQLKTYMSVKGVGDVQSRAWIEYGHTKSNVSIRSFSLGHIK